MKTIKSVSLYFKEGSSDKVYKATMLKSQLKENKDNELLRLIAANTANKEVNERKPLIKNLS